MQRLRDRVKILGIDVDPISMNETLEILDEYVRAGEPKLIVTADAAGIVAAQSDEEWRAIMLGADLVTPDSVGVLWAAKRAGSPISSRVSGVELVEKLVEKGYRTYFLGAAPGVAAAARQRLSEKYPCANVVGVRDGFFRETEEPGVAAEIRKLNPQVLFVAMGIPKQEKFLSRNMHTVGSVINMGVGGSFDVLSGNVKRAPLWLQRLRLEWLWRLIQNPKKWRKVASLPEFWWRVVRSGRGQKAN
jgi:N-acetylglucosaminyldiphosphoundecaprenol N-acetyl-beta-D-mannosaminyltransferase